MNERILELAEQSGLYHRLATGSLYPSAMTAEECSTAYEKFAELIVRECANIIGEENYTMLTGKAYCVQLKRHFGVEE